MSSVFKLWRFENSLAPGQEYKGFDKIFIPQVAYTTGDLDVHDVMVDDQNRPVFISFTK